MSNGIRNAVETEGVAATGRKEGNGKWWIVGSGTGRKGYSLAGKSKDENNMAIK